MKTILLFMCLLVASVANATEYVIAKSTNVTTVYIIENAGDNSEYINVYVLSSKPTILDLQEIGLPSELWSILDQGDQIYDTRLEAKKSLTAQYQGLGIEQADKILSLEGDIFTYKLLLILFGVIIIGLVIVIGTKNN